MPAPEIPSLPVQGAYIADKKAAIKGALELGNVDNTSDANKPVSTLTQTALNLKANLASPTFTGTVGGITKSMVGLGNVDNTTDLNKPISTLTQAALDLKANLATSIQSDTTLAGGASGSPAGTAITNMVLITNTAYEALAGINPPTGIDQTSATTVYIITTD